MTETVKMRDVRRAAVSCAKDEWQKNVRDPRDRERIIHYHESIGADWATDDGYQESEDFWCGVFAGYCFDRVGEYLFSNKCVDLGLADGLGEQIFNSTTRMAGKGPFTFAEYGLKPFETLDPGAIEPGDIAVISTGRTKRPWGDHVTISASEPTSGGLFRTYEGNATGTLGDGSRGEGVVRWERRFEEIAVVYRMRREHFDGLWPLELEGNVE